MSILEVGYDKHIENRGEIFTFYDKNDFPDIEFVQDKLSVSHRGVVRGFHGDGITHKLITCLDGKIQFIAYDIKENKKKEFILDSENLEHTSILLSPYVVNAHQCLSKNCTFLYKLSEFYTPPEQQWSVKYNDETIGAKWMLPITNLSDRDRKAGSLEDLEQRITNERRSASFF
jgi:dTDP-4-dehydrorhamnose 3,5-epimerase